MSPAETHFQPFLSSLPVLVLFPHSRCDCRCLMCDIWKDKEAREISREELARHVTTIRDLQVRWVVFSGGEPLLHSDLFRLSDLLRELGIRVTLLSTGLLLKDHARNVAERTDDAILSLDGPEEIHDRIRRVQGAFAHLTQGMVAVRRHRPAFSFACRTTVQRANFRFLRQTVAAARETGFDSISFLAADVRSTAFNRPGGWNEIRQNQIALSVEEIPALEEEIESLIREWETEITTGFIREGAEKLRRIVLHFRAHLGDADAVSPKCNAPWVSAVIESDGSVRPCFFHKILGNIRDKTLIEVLNSEDAVAFRRGLDIPTNPICRHCVCSLHLPEEVVA
jgi:MoaA/NifB/PqqE/SkfB family radical SAM enzyme